MIYAMNLMKARLFGNLHAMVVLSILLSGCASTGGAGGNIGASSVGPKRIEATEVMADASPAISKPFMVVPIFDPNIPKDKARIEELSIWPEVRRTEAVRGAITLTNKL